MDEVFEQLREAVAGRAFINADELSRDTELLDSAILDSEAIVEIAALMADISGKTVLKNDRIPANFRSIGAMVAFIERNAQK